MANPEEELAKYKQLCQKMKLKIEHQNEQIATLQKQPPQLQEATTFTVDHHDDAHFPRREAKAMLLLQQQQKRRS